MIYLAVLAWPLPPVAPVLPLEWQQLKALCRKGYSLFFVGFCFLWDVAPLPRFEWVKISSFCQEGGGVRGLKVERRAPVKTVAPSFFLTVKIRKGGYQNIEYI